MSKKLQGNGLFESSRMMLPEHKEAYIEHQQGLDRKVRPILDEQQTEDISRSIADSMLTGEEITFMLFGEFGEQKVTGRVVKIDQRQKAIKLAGADGDEWVGMDRILRMV
jgi:hypothetical protein